MDEDGVPVQQALGGEAVQSLAGVGATDLVVGSAGLEVSVQEQSVARMSVSIGSKPLSGVVAPERPVVSLLRIVSHEGVSYLARSFPGLPVLVRMVSGRQGEGLVGVRVVLEGRQPVAQAQDEGVGGQPRWPWSITRSRSRLTALSIRSRSRGIGGLGRTSWKQRHSW